MLTFFSIVLLISVATDGDGSSDLALFVIMPKSAAESAAQQNIAQLTEMLNNPNRKDGNVLRVYYELFQLSNEGRDLSVEIVSWLNEIASLFLSPRL